MKTRLTRRRLLAGAGCLCGSAAFVARFAPSAIAADKRPDWPVACRDATLRSTGHKDCWSALQAMGAEGAEVAVADDLTLPYLFHPTAKYALTTAADRQRLASDAQAAGQRIVAFTTSNRFEERLDFEIRWCAEVAEAAQALGVPVIRIDVQRQKLAPEKFFTQAVEALKKVLAAIERMGITVGHREPQRDDQRAGVFSPHCLTPSAPSGSV